MSERVLFFSHETTLSGAPMQLLHLLPQLETTRFEITFAAPEAGPISQELAARGVRVVFQPDALQNLDRTALRELCRDFDVVVANTIAAWPVIRAARESGVPSIWYIHETQVGPWLMERIPYIRPTLLQPTAIVTPTATTAKIYEQFTPVGTRVVPYGIPDLGFAPRPNESPLRFLLLGTYELRKGQDVMIDAIRRLPDDVKTRCHFAFAGRALEPDIFSIVETAAAELPNVTALTDLTHDAARQLLSEHDVLVCASRDETMPLAIIEAMSLGRAIISTDVGGIRECFRDNENGALVPSENASALAGAIERFAKERNVVARFVSAARETYEEHFRLERFVERFGSLLDEVARTRRPKHFPAANDYQHWLAEYDAFTERDAAALRQRLRQLPRQPLISVVMPVFNPDPRFLRAAIDSVRQQVYERWELCIADDASTDPEVRRTLEEASQSDPRIKVVFRKTNGHISAASNSALALATGEWCALLDHDDALAPNALSHVARESAAQPHAALIYSDEDKIDENGTRSNPFFKTDWNPELFYGQNFINHLGVYRTSLLREIGGFREGFEGSQDYDLALRCIERLRANQIRHIPRVLYHWRTAAGSLAGVVDAKPYAREAARRAIADHLERRGINAAVTACPENNESHRAIFELGESRPPVSIIILTRDRAALLRQCVESIRSRTDYENRELLIIDNASREEETHDLLGQLKQQPNTRVLRDEGEFNFSRLNNLAAKEARSELLLFMNNDIEAQNLDWLTEMVSHFVRAEVGIVGARLWFPDDTMQHGGVVLGLGGAAGHAFVRHPRGHPGYFNRAWLQGNYSAVTGACMLVRRELFERLGGFNERELAINFNDIDFCLRARKIGYEIVWTPYANLTHHESASRGHHRSRDEQQQFRREVTHFQNTWAKELLRDPFYNANLTLNLPGFTLAFPPRIG